MTGTGTQADPLILTSAADLYALSTVGGPLIYCKLGCDIDFNGTPYAANFTPISLCCCELDGDGYAIRNIYKNTPASAVVIFALPYYNMNLTVKNLRIENTVLTGTDIAVFYAADRYNLTFSNCTFVLSIKKMGDYTVGQSDYSLIMGGNFSASLDLCTVAVSGSCVKNFVIASGCTFNRCHIHLELTIGSGDAYDGSYRAFFYSDSFTDSYITGSVTALSQLSGNTNMSYGCAFNNSYTAVEYTDQDDVFWSGTMITVCFYDKQLAGNRDFTDQRTYYGLTTAQCKDASYLSSLGFTVAEDE